MTILITGANGQLGRALQQQFQVAEHTAPNMSMKVVCTDAQTFDITSQQQVDRIIQELRPQVVINCAAYTAVDQCEEDEEGAYTVNSLGPKYLAQACQQVGAKLVHISTDYVFSGAFNEECKPWKETDPVAPQNVYGKTKWQGEEYVRTYCEQHFVVRTAWLYGEGNNFVRTMLKLAETNRELSVVADQFGNPTSTKDLAIAIINLMQTEYYGTYHGTCEGTCSWYDFAKKIFEIKAIAIVVNPVTSEAFVRPAKRPQYSSLDNVRLKLHGLNTFRPWEEALVDYLEEKE